MTLDVLIRGAPKTQPVGAATAIPATGATEERGRAGTVARVATIAVADPRSAKTEGNSAQPDDAALWWRVAITEPGGRTIEVDTPSGWTLGEWAAYVARYHGPGCTVTPIAGLPEAQAPVDLDEVLAGATDGVGITPAQFRALLSAEDLQDVAAGDIAVETLRGYTLSFAKGIRSGRIVVREGAKPDPASGSIVITDAELEAARKGQLGP